MALTITTTITVADDEAYTAREQAILAAIAAHPAGKGITAAAPAVEGLDMLAHTREAADARIAESKAKAAADAKAKAATEAKAKAAADAKAAKEAAAEAEAEEEPAEEPSEDLVGGEEPVPGYTLEEAVAAATKLVSTGKAAAVKAALAGTGAKKVSELKGDDITTFMTALEV